MTALDKINNYRLILASRSPRRKQLMDELGLGETETVPSAPGNKTEEKDGDE